MQNINCINLHIDFQFQWPQMTFDLQSKEGIIFFQNLQKRDMHHSFQAGKASLVRQLQNLMSMIKG